MTLKRFLPNHARLSGLTRRWLTALCVLASLLCAFRATAANCFPPPAGLVGWWPGDGTPNDIIGNNNATLTGGATDTAVGMVGQAFSFDGATGFAQIPDSPAFHPANLTIEAWVMFNSLDSTASGGSPAGYQYIVFKQNSRPSGFEGFVLSKIRLSGGDAFRFLVTSSAGASVGISSVTLISTGVWYHLAGVRGPNFTQLFVNGQLEAQATVTFPQDYGNLPLYFGTTGQSYWDHKFSGELDEVSLYNRALSSNEIASIFAAGSSGKCKSPSPPAIVTPPQSQTVLAGTNVNFTVAASGTAPLAYQWLRNGTNLTDAGNISGSGSSALALADVQVSDSANYQVMVTNASGSVTSAVAMLTVNPNAFPPSINVQPASQTISAGSGASFTVSVSGTAPLNYQWLFNGVNLSNGGQFAGATSPMLTISGAQTNNSGAYSVMVTNVFGSVTSMVATLTVNPNVFPPSINVQPSSQTISTGSGASFTVSASGTAPLSYQWLFNGANLSNGGQFTGATSPTLTITGAQTNNSGGYSVVVTNVIGSVTSMVATLTVNPPIISSNGCVPAPANIIGWWTGDGTASDSAGADNGTLQGGATDTATGLVGQAFGFNGTSSFVQIPDSAVLHPANLTIEAWVLFNSLNSQGSGGSPAGDQYIVFKQNSRAGDFEGFDLSKTRFNNGDGFRFLVTSSGGVSVEVDSITRVTTGTWYHVAAVRGPNFTQIYVNGHLEAQAAVNFPQDYGALPLFFGSSGESYWDHKLSGMLDEMSLYNRALTSNEIAAIHAAGTSGKCKSVSGITIVTPPQAESVAVGNSIALSVNASGPAPLTYQWLFDGGVFAGATNPGLTIGNAQLSNSGGYSVIVADGAGSVTSAVAVVNVLLPPTIATPPQSVTSLAGSNASFSVVAGGSGPFSYQWQFGAVNLVNGGRVSGATSATLTISGLITGDAGNYQVIVANPVGAVTSSPAVLTIVGPPVIVSQPASQIVATGTNATFSVAAAGTAPLGYQWLFDGTNLPNGGQFNGVNTTTLSVGGVQTANVGNYSVVVTNFAGSVTSLVATLSLNGVPNCITPPPNLVGWWTGDGSANDSVGGNNGILEGGATATASGYVAQAFYFDGVNGFVEIPDSPAFHPTNLTIEAWVMFSSLDTPASGGSPAGDEYIVFKQNSQYGNFEGFDLGKSRFSNGDGFRFLVTSASAQSVEVDSVSRITTGVWYHIAGVRGPNYLQIYVNGQLEAQATVGFAQDYGSLPLYFGTSGESYWDHKLSGELDEVSLYNRALGANEISAIYAAGAAGKCKGPGLPTAPVITAQPASQIVTVGNPVSLDVSATGTAPLNYQWFKDGLKLFDGTNITGSTTPNLILARAQLSDVGVYKVTVANSIGSTLSTGALLTTGVPPPNDNFANGQAISGASGSVSGNNFNATKEAGEPTHAGNSGGASVWYDWTAPSASPVTFDTCLSAIPTLLAVYTGSSVGALTPVASSANISSNNVHSRLTFTPVAGTVYRIAVDGFNDAQGSLTLRWVQASVPLPDLSIVASAVNPEIVTNTFAASSCAVLEGLVQAGSRTLIRFSTQTENSGNANLYFGNPASNPLFVWAPCHAHYHFQNYMSYRLRDSNGKLAAVGLKVGFCVLDVFRWNPNSAPNALYTCSNQGIQQGWGDLYDSSLDGQWIDITGLPAGNYTIELEANPQGIIQESNYGNNLTTVPIQIGNPNAPPLNDNFVNAQALLGGFASVPGNNVNASKEAGEPNHAGNAGGHSVWYEWTALSTKSVTVDTIGSSFDTLLAVYTGNSLTALTLVASNDNLGPGTIQSRVNFSATAGSVYRIAVDGANGATGNIILTLNQTIGNDNFAYCEFVGGVSGSVYGSNAGATKESGEPDHAGNPGGASIWYCWTAPINGQVTFDTIGSTFDTLLAVYTGSAVNALTPIASNDNIDAAGGDLQSRVTFNAIGLTMYHIAIDGFNGATGDTVLNWNLVSSGNGPLAIAQSGALPEVKLFTQPGGPVLVSKFLSEGECQLGITGQPQASYRVETSCDLQHWKSTVTTVADNSGQAWFIDKSTVHSSQQSSGAEQFCGAGTVLGVNTSPGNARFYRVVVVGSQQ
jgi:hypothetical protein